MIEDTPPALPCYPGPQRNLQACAELEVELNNSTFIRDNPIALDYPFNNACPTFNSSLGPPPGNCTLGSAPVYTVNATTPEDVAKAVAFAKDRKIRPVIRNTGHDFLGRQALNTNMVMETYSHILILETLVMGVYKFGSDTSSKDSSSKTYTNLPMVALGLNGLAVPSLLEGDISGRMCMQKLHNEE